LNILVVSSCTSKKAVNSKYKLLKEDFLDSVVLEKREKELSKKSLPAIEMYKGMQHIQLVKGLSSLRAKYGNCIVDLKIISAGYGLIDEAKKIVPYEVTFNSMKSKEIDEWSSFLNIKRNLEIVIKDYDLIIFLLGDRYLRSLQLPLSNISKKKRLIFLASKSSSKKIPNEKPYYFLEVGQDDASSFGYGLVGLKGYLFNLLAKEIEKQGKIVFEDIYQNPNLLLDILYKYRKDK